MFWRRRKDAPEEPETGPVVDLSDLALNPQVQIRLDEFIAGYARRFEEMIANFEKRFAEQHAAFEQSFRDSARSYQILAEASIEQGTIIPRVERIEQALENANIRSG